MITAMGIATAVVLLVSPLQGSESKEEGCGCERHGEMEREGKEQHLFSNMRGTI
jgi:hypothetical protein